MPWSERTHKTGTVMELSRKNEAVLGAYRSAEVMNAKNVPSYFTSQPLMRYMQYSSKPGHFESRTNLNQLPTRRDRGTLFAVTRLTHLKGTSSNRWDWRLVKLSRMN